MCRRSGDAHLTRRSGMLVVGCLLLLAAGSGPLLGRPGWGVSWIGLALGALLMLLALLGDADRRGGPPARR